MPTNFVVADDGVEVLIEILPFFFFFLQKGKKYVYFKIMT